MNNYKHAYWVNKDNVPCYTAYSTPTEELNELISKNKCIVLDQAHEFCQKFDRNLLFLPAYIYDYENKTINIDINIAKNIVLNLFRNRRNSLLRELDIEQLKYLTNPEKLAKIDNIKQLLRDLPVQINNALSRCETLTDLNHVLPPIL